MQFKYSYLTPEIHLLVSGERGEIRKFSNLDFPRCYFVYMLFILMVILCGVVWWYTGDYGTQPCKYLP